MRASTLHIVAFIALVRGENGGNRRLKGEIESGGRTSLQDLLQTKKAIQVCSPESTFKNVCQTCNCSKDGTALTCNILEICERHKRNKRQIPFTCIPNQTFMRDCNTCTCNANGRNAICTLMACRNRTFLPKGYHQIDPGFAPRQSPIGPFSTSR